MRYHETCTPRTHISYTYTCIQRYPVPAIFGSLLHSWCCRCFCPHICVCVICVCVSVFISLSLEDMYSLSLSLSLPLSLSLSFSLPLSLSLSLYLPLSLKFNQKWTRPRLEPTLLYQSAQSALILLQVHTQMCVCTWRAPRSGSSLSLQLPARKLPAARQGHVRRWAWITAGSHGKTLIAWPFSDSLRICRSAAAQLPRAAAALSRRAGGGCVQPLTVRLASEL